MKKEAALSRSEGNDRNAKSGKAPHHTRRKNMRSSSNLDESESSWFTAADDKGKE